MLILVSSSSKQLDLKYPEIDYYIDQNDSSPFVYFLLALDALKECFSKSDLPVKLHIPTKAYAFFFVGLRTIVVSELDN